MIVRLIFQGLSYKRATEMGLETARLPMSEILKDKPNTSLNQNHGTPPLCVCLTMASVQYPHRFCHIWKFGRGSTDPHAESKRISETRKGEREERRAK